MLIAATVIASLLFTGLLVLRGGRNDELNDATRAYIASLDLDAMRRAGCDFTSERFSPLRLGKPPEEIDRVHDYDFARLETVRNGLEDVSRHAALRHVFNEVTRGCTTNVERHLAVLRFLNEISIHNPLLQPMWPDGRRVADPLILLEVNEMRCGTVSELAVDLFEAGGFQGRLAVLAGHVIAEVRYDGDWHYLDADLFGGGQTVLDTDGSIPSLAELSRDPLRLDALGDGLELNWRGTSRGGSAPYRSWHYFTAEAYRESGDDPRWLIKTATRDLEAQDRDFGWNRTRVTPDEERELHFMPRRFQPGAVRFRSVKLEQDVHAGRTVAHITWRPSRDRDDDLLGYRVFVSERSRGWSYSAFTGTDEARPFWHDTGGWRPEMYNRLFELPPHDVALIETTAPEATIEIEPGRTVYITVMPFDAHGERVGRTLYRMSEELRITATE